jgi:LacI family gluconate utilization system Gnt-I transcriptional repressor
VAISTASRALNNPEIVSAPVLKRVKDTVERTGYVPNLLAGSLASNRSKLVAIIIPSISASVFLPTVSAVTEALAANGYQVMLGQSGYVESREDHLLATIISRRPDAIILTGIVHSVVGRRRLSAAGVPVVETWDLTPTPIDMLVGFSHERVGIAVAEYFHARGVRRPGVISAKDSRAQLRNAGFCAAAKKLGMGPVTVHLTPAPSTLGHGRVGLRDLLQQGPDLDGVMCGSDPLAHGVIIEAQALGLKVPGQLAVMGFGNMSFGADTTPSISTVGIDGEAIGQQAAKFIVDRIAGRPIANRVVDVGTAIVKRESA